MAQRIIVAQEDLRMAESIHRLSFERPIYELEERIQKLEGLAAQNPAARNEVRQLRRALTDLKKQIYGQLKPWETVEVARHPDRPMTTDYLELGLRRVRRTARRQVFRRRSGHPHRLGQARHVQGDGRRAIRKVRRSRSGMRAFSAAPIPKATARRWPRCRWPRSSTCR